jgi:hypothetical protein
MSEETGKAGTVQSEHGIGTRPRRLSESTYGFPNHEDGIQSGNFTGGDSAQTTPADEGNTTLTGPGSTNSNGMKGQK